VHPGLDSALSASFSPALFTQVFKAQQSLAVIDGLDVTQSVQVLARMEARLRYVVTCQTRTRIQAASHLFIGTFSDQQRPPRKNAGEHRCINIRARANDPNSFLGAFSKNSGKCGRACTLNKVMSVCVVDSDRLSDLILA
jgi:hypothetical protein